MAKDDKKKQKEENKEESAQPVETTVTTTTAPVTGKLKVNIETPGPIYTINGYGPMYNLELDENVVFDLLREGVIVTDSATRKRIVIKEGKPSVE